MSPIKRTLAVLGVFLAALTITATAGQITKQPAGVKQYAPISTAKVLKVAGIPAPSDMVMIGTQSGVVGQTEEFIVPVGQRLVITGAGCSSEVTRVSVERNQGGGFSVIWAFVLRAQDGGVGVMNPSAVNTLGTPSCLFFEEGDIIRGTSSAGNPVLVGYLSSL
jgi:hypothetical protein